jgi:hypothetical protein
MGNSSSFSILWPSYRRERVAPLNPIRSIVEPPKPTEKDSTTTVQDKLKLKQL